MTEEDVPHFKIIFLGDQYVGKSSILNRFYQDKFEEDYQATIGLDFHSKNVDINNTTIRLLLYDTAGQEKFKSLIPMYIRDANIIIVVYDITNKDSFIHTEHWANETKDLKREDAIFVLVGNKTDLEDKRVISRVDGEKFAEDNGLLFFETSAKSGKNVEELFNQCTTEIISRIEKGLIAVDASNSGIKIGVAPNKEIEKNYAKNNKGCC